MSKHTFCSKDRYATADAAERAMKSIAKRGKKKRGLKLSSYKCEFCGFFHWGHYGTKETPHRRERKTKNA